MRTRATGVMQPFVALRYGMKMHSKSQNKGLWLGRARLRGVQYIR